MKYQHPNMGYIRIGTLKGGAVYLLDTFVLWNRKGDKRPHSRLPEDTYANQRKGSRTVERFENYLWAEGARKPIKLK